MTVQQAKRAMTSTEFLDWKLHLEEKVNELEPLHYYLAQIPQEIRRVLHKKPDSVLLEHFLFKFEAKEAKPVAVELTEDERAARTAASKAMWGAVAGVRARKR